MKPIELIDPAYCPFIMAFPSATQDPSGKTTAIFRCNRIVQDHTESRFGEEACTLQDWERCPYNRVLPEEHTEIK